MGKSATFVFPLRTRPLWPFEWSAHFSAALALPAHLNAGHFAALLACICTVQSPTSHSTPPPSKAKAAHRLRPGSYYNSKYQKPVISTRKTVSRINLS